VASGKNSQRQRWPHANPHRHLISIFNDNELELLISGLPDIDVADLRANTEFQGYSPNTPVVRWEGESTTQG